MIVDRLTIRARITIGSFLLASIFFAGTAVLVHGQVESILDSATMEILESDAAPFTAPSVDLATEGAEPPGEDELVALVDPEGVVTLSTIPEALAGQIPELVAAGPGGHTATTAGAEYRVLVSAVATDAGQWHVVTARSEASNRLVLDRLTAGLGWGLVALTAVFTLVAWQLSGASLRPISRLRRSAEALAAERSTAVLPIGPARDEVSALATTLNGLIVRLRAAAERERQMVSDVSHDLRTPLAVAQGQLELLADAVPFDQREDVETARAAVERLSKLVSSLLELSRLESHTGVGSATVAEITREIGDAVDRARVAAAGSDIEIEYAVPADASRAVVGLEVTTFGRVLDNLLQNAVNAVGATGRVRIELSDTGDEVQVTVADDGPGMPADFVDRAFDRFSRADPARHARAGTGLGLAIVSAAVEDAHGEIALDSSPAGLRVLIRLPAVDPPRIQPKPEGGTEDESDAVGSDGIRER